MPAEHERYSLKIKYNTWGDEGEVRLPFTATSYAAALKFATRMADAADGDLKVNEWDLTILEDDE